MKDQEANTASGCMRTPVGQHAGGRGGGAKPSTSFHCISGNRIVELICCVSSLS